MFKAKLPQLSCARRVVDRGSFVSSAIDKVTSKYSDVRVISQPQKATGSSYKVICCHELQRLATIYSFDTCRFFLPSATKMSSK